MIDDGESKQKKKCNMFLESAHNTALDRRNHEYLLGGFKSKGTSFSLQQQPVLTCIHNPVLREVGTTFELAPDFFRDSPRLVVAKCAI